MVMTLTKMILVNAPVELVWSYVENPLQVASLSDRISKVNNIVPCSLGGYNCTMVYDADGQAVEVTVQTTEYLRHERLVTRMSPGLDSTQTWTLKQTGTVTTLNLEFEYHVNVPLLGRLAESAATRRIEADIEKMLLRLKDVCESLSAQRPNDLP